MLTLTCPAMKYFSKQMTSVLPIHKHLATVVQWHLCKCTLRIRCNSNLYNNAIPTPLIIIIIKLYNKINVCQHKQNFYYLWIYRNLESEWNTLANDCSTIVQIYFAHMARVCNIRLSPTILMTISTVVVTTITILWNIDW